MDEVARFGVAVSGGVVCLDTCVEDLAAIGVEPGGAVGGDDGDGVGEILSVNQFNDRSEVLLNRPVETSAENGIDDGVTGQAAGFYLLVKDGDGLRPGFSIDKMEGKPQFADDGQVDGGITLDQVWVDQKKEDRLAASLVQMSADHQAITAVVAGADEDAGEGVFAGTESPLHHQDSSQACVLHQDYARDVKFFDGTGVKRPHFRGGW